MFRRPGYHLFEKDRSLVVSDGTPIVYTVRGSGRSGHTFLLANGWSCSDAYWKFLVPRLEAAGHRVVVSDIRGHGDSGFPRDPGYRARNLGVEDFAVSRIAADLWQICDAEGIDQAIIVGHSMGVQTTLEAYRLAPERTEALVAVAGSYENPLKTFYGRSFDPLWPAGKVAVQLIPRFLLPAWRLLGNQAGLGHRAALLVKAAGPKVTKDLLAPYIAHLTTRDPLVLFLVIEAMRDHSAADLLPEIDIPTLVLAAENDTFTPLSVQQRMHELVPRSELVVFPDATHCLPLEEPDAIHDALADFLGRRVAPADRPSPSEESA